MRRATTALLTHSDLTHTLVAAARAETNVTRIAVPAHIVARIRAGEDVSAEEITAAQEAEAKKQAKLAKSGKSGKPSTPRSDPANEWIPEGHSSAQGKKGKRV